MKRKSASNSKKSKRVKSATTTTNLPQDIWKIIFSFCNFKTLAIFGQSCKDFYKVTRDEGVILTRLSLYGPKVVAPEHVFPECSSLELAYLQENDHNYAIIKDIVFSMVKAKHDDGPDRERDPVKRGFPAFNFTYKKYKAGYYVERKTFKAFNLCLTRVWFNGYGLQKYLQFGNYGNLGNIIMRNEKAAMETLQISTDGISKRIAFRVNKYSDPASCWVSVTHPTMNLHKFNQKLLYYYKNYVNRLVGLIVDERESYNLELSLIAKALEIKYNI